MKRDYYSAFFNIAAAFIMLSSEVSAQLPKRVDGESIKATITYLSSDEFKGRETGSPECTMAEDYFAKEFKKLKLLPGGENDSYYYNFSFKSRNEVTNQTLIIDGREFYSGRGEDFNLTYRGDGGNADGEIVFAGYGINSPEKNRNDFENLDIKGKIVLMKRGAPGNDMAGWKDYASDPVKAEYCYKNGATAVLLYEPYIMRAGDEAIPNGYLVLKEFPVFTIDERVVRHIFKDSRYSYWRIMQTIENKPSSFPTGKLCKMSATVVQGKEINGRNVLGILPGTDPKLKNEYIMIGGHLDHIGIGPDGSIRNGADDNASGPSVSLGIAQAMVKNKFRPKRSIVFVAWTGEEMGLWGSRLWCEKPSLDLTKIVVYFNLDMVGLGDGKLNMPGTEFAPEIYDFLTRESDSLIFKQINWRKGGLGGSDHNHFLLNGVPAFAGMTSGPHPDYHQEGDDAEKIQTEILQLTGDFLYYCSEKIAGSKEVFLSGKRLSENRLKLINRHFLTPLSSLTFETALKNSNSKVAIIDFSELAVSGVPVDNFISLLKGFETCQSKTSADGNYILGSTASESLYAGWNDKTGLVALYNPEAIGYDEIWFKALAKYGYRLITLDENSTITADSSGLKKLLSLSEENGVGLVLDLGSGVSLETVLSNTKNPCIILHNSPEIPEIMVSRIKEGRHLLVFQLNPETGIDTNLNQLLILKEKLGNEHISFAPGDQSESSIRFYNEFLLRFVTEINDREIQSMILENNFIRFANESLQTK